MQWRGGKLILAAFSRNIQDWSLRIGGILLRGTCFDDPLQVKRKAVDRHGGNRILCCTARGRRFSSREQRKIKEQIRTIVRYTRSQLRKAWLRYKKCSRPGGLRFRSLSPSVLDIYASACKRYHPDSDPV